MLQIPTPGTIVNVSGIPEDLRRINQWVVWKPMLRKSKLVKVPVSYAYPLGDNINAHDPMYWTTFDEAVSVMHADPRFGIGLVLDGTGLICLDYDDHHGDDVDAVRNGAAFMADIQLSFPTYVERSLQGQGKHSFYRATLPHGRTGGMIEQLNLEIYAAQFIAITGNVVVGAPSYVANGQVLVDAWNLPPPVASADSIEATTRDGRYLTADDEQIILTLKMRRESTYNMMSNGTDLSDRSTAYAQIIGDLDKVTGDPRQIDRIIRGAPFFRNGYNSEKYDQSPRWLAKYDCASMLEYWLKQARKDNNDTLQLYMPVTPEQRAFMDEVVRNTLARQKEEVKKELVSAVVTQQDVAHDVKSDSPIARLHYVLEDEVGGDFDRLSVPPGIVGQFVNALAPMLTGARLTYVIPAVISTLSGYLGQTFKIPGPQIGLVNQFIIAGQMNTGKTSTMNVLENAIDAALDGWYRNPDRPTKLKSDGDHPLTHNRRILKTRAASAHGIFDTLSRIGASTWFADEAESQIDLMSSGQPLGVSLKAFLKEAFDASNPTKQTTLDASRANTREGVPDILNMTLPMYWSCTSEVFQRLGLKEMIDGLYSRINMIYDEKPMDAEVSDLITVHKGLPKNLMQIMQRIALIADHTASAYDQAGLAKMLKDIQSSKGAEGSPTKEDYRKKIQVCKRAGEALCVDLDFSSDQKAEALRKRIDKVCQRLGHDANPHVGAWPEHYQILARTNMLPMMVAGVLAACDAIAKWDLKIPPEQSDWRKTMPQVVVTAEHLQWSFEMVMHFRLRLFKAWDSGKIAVKMSDDETVYLRCLEKCLANGTHVQTIEGTLWVEEHFLVDQVVRREPFKTADTVGRNSGRSAGRMMVKDTQKRLHEVGRIIVAKASDLGLQSRSVLVSKVV